MENSYGIGVQNRYELFFDEDADPFELIKKPVVKDSTEEKENKDKSKVKASNKKGTKLDGVAKTVEKVAVQGELLNFRGRHYAPFSQARMHYRKHVLRSE